MYDPRENGFYGGPMYQPPGTERWLGAPFPEYPYAGAAPVPQCLMELHRPPYPSPVVAQVFHPQPAPAPPPQPGWIFSNCEVCVFCLLAVLITVGTAYIGTIELVTYLVLKCSSSLLGFILGIVANYSIALAALITIPLASKARYSIICTVFAFIFGLVSIGCNIALVVLLVLKSGKHLGRCYLRQNMQWYLVALSMLEVFLVVDILCYLPAMRSRIKNQRILNKRYNQS